MPFILAIEPDPRQASRVEALAPEHLDAEIVVVGTVDAALSVLRARRPDLVLTPLLLSAKDDGVLTERLREFDTDGVQLQTLVIPVLATGADRPAPLEQPGRLFARLRRAKVTATGSGDGCAPAVFAAQITEYLARVAADRHDRDEVRRANEWAAAPRASAPMLGEWLKVPVLSPSLSQMDAPAHDPELPDVVFADEVESPAPVESPVSVEQSELVSPELILQPANDQSEPDLTIEASWEDLESFLEDLEIEESTHAVEVAASVDDVEPDAIELPSPDELWAPLERTQNQTIAPLEGPTVTKKRAPSVTKTAKATRPSSKSAQPPAPKRPRRPKAAPKPLQDEWGLYDPEQCGFAALLERLQELNESEPPAKERRGRSAIMRR